MTLLEIFAKTKILAVIFDNTVIQRNNFLRAPAVHETDKPEKIMPHLHTLGKLGFN